MNKPILTPRLKTIADLIASYGNSNVIADIGTDHAYLPVYLSMSEICEKAIASDIRKGPLERAKATINKYGMSGKVEVRLGSGLETVAIDDCADTIVIAGMGGMVISDIIASSMDVIKKARCVILQPMTMAPELRKYLYSLNFGEISERIVIEEEKIYNIIDITNIDSSRVPYCMTDAELYIGKDFVDFNSDEYKRYLQNQKRKLKSIINGLSKAENEEGKIKLKKTIELLNAVENM